MRSFLMLSIIALAALGWAWWGVSGPPAAPWQVEAPVEAGVVEGLLRRILAASRPYLGELSEETCGRLRSALERLLILARAAPVIGLGISAAVLAGLVVREEARAALRFSSPTWNYVGKRLGAASAVALVALPAVPAGVPFWGCLVAAVGVCAGVGLYVGNLPAKL